MVPLIAVLVDIVLQQSWRRHLRMTMWLAAVPALIIYFLPFWASSHFGGAQYGENGLYLVYRENILRYLQPFDHQGPIYTYLIYLPIYLLPWTFFFIPALFNLPQRWRTLGLDSKWIVWTLGCLFLFFTLSGSRRSYYVLPLVPFAILLTADWLFSQKKNTVWYQGLIGTAFVLIFLAWVIVPAWFYKHFGVNQFAMVLKQEAQQLKPWQAWNVVLLDGESKLNFYLALPPSTKNYYLKKTQYSATTLSNRWPILMQKPENTIFISRQMHAADLQPFFPNYRLIQVPMKLSWGFLNQYNQNAPIAFIPSELT